MQTALATEAYFRCMYALVMSGKRPCSECGCGKFIVLPHLSLEFDQCVDGDPGLTSKIHRNVTITLVVCASCAHTGWYTTNAEAVMQKVDGAQVIEATT